jgi:spermidine/putrescine transport system permease protein
VAEADDVRTPARLLAPLTIYLVLFLVVPLLLVFVYSIRTFGGYGIVLPQLTLQNYVDCLSEKYLAVLLRSIAYASMATVACLLLGYPLAYCIAMYGGRRKNMLLLLVMLPFWTSYLVRIYAWRTILAGKGFLNLLLLHLHLIAAPLQILNTPFAVVLGLTYGFLPFMTLPLYTSIEKLDRTLLDAALDLGATPISAFLRVALPLTAPGVVAGVILTFIPALGDFVTPDLIGGPETQMIGNVIESKFFIENDWVHGSALAFILMAMLMIALFIYARKAEKEVRG